MLKKVYPSEMIFVGENCHFGKKSVMSCKTRPKFPIFLKYWFFGARMC